MLEGVLIKLMKVLSKDSLFKKSLTGKFDSVLASDKGNSDLIQIRKLEARKTELVIKISNGVEELLHWKDNPRIKEKFRNEIQSMDTEVSEIENMLKSEKLLAGNFDTLAQLNTWLNLIVNINDIPDKQLEDAGLNYFSQFIDTFLIDSTSIEIKFNIDMLATITLPKVVTKSIENFECQLGSSTLEITRKNFVLELDQRVTETPPAKSRILPPVPQ